MVQKLTFFISDKIAYGNINICILDQGNLHGIFFAILGNLDKYDILSFPFLDHFFFL